MSDEKEKFCKMLDKAIKDERNSPDNYSKLLRSILKMVEDVVPATTPIEVLDKLGEASRVIGDISRQEYEHHGKLIEIKRNICEV